ncbi:MAG: acetate--CoA ligase family protein [Acidobacteria bacterium]|nr:acetate--CoA ligase family protein [Acidobacteriota bacterium]
MQTLTKFDLDAMFKPRSIALVGAARDLTKLSGRPLRFLKDYGYPGKIYPINPNCEEIAGFKCYPDLKSVPDDIDLAVVMLPAKAVPAAIKECAAKGVKAATVFTAGFAEVSAEGRRMQEEMRQAAIEGGVALSGPNCAGLVSVREKSMGTFNTAMDRGSLREGPISFVAQSGALGTYMFGAAQDAGVGFNYWVSTGNEAVLGLPEFVSYFIKQETTKGIIGYMEDARDGEAFKRCATEALVAGKPLIILKVGVSDSGAKAATSHTGALAGSDKVYDAVFEQYGVIRAHDVEQLFDFATICTAPHYPEGPNTAMMTISGGAGILMCDRCEQAGLKVATLKDETIEALRPVLPAFASLVNPVDVTAELVATPGLLKTPMEIVLADPNVDSLVIFLGLQLHTGTALARDIVEVASKTDKMVAVNWIAPPAEALGILRENHIPVFSDPGRGIRALGALAGYVRRRERFMARSAKAATEVGTDRQTQDEARAIIQTIRREELAFQKMSEAEGKAILSLYGIPSPKRTLATSATQAVKAAGDLGFPVVMKISSPGIPHKTEAGGVRLGIADAQQVSRAYDEIIANAKSYNPKAKLDGVLVEQMITGGVQVMVGFKQDARFGPAVTFGMGGIYVELMGDVSLRVLPFDEEEALDMMQGTKVYRLLTGFRGDRPRDIGALAKVIVAVGRLAQDFKDELVEVDINPVLVLPEGKGVVAVDSLMVLESATTKMVRKFASKVRKELGAQRVILFGSHVTGDNSKSSDFDFIIVSEKFQGKHLSERPSDTYPLWEEAAGTKVKCYTPDEFATELKQDGFVQSAVREGIEL